jgi:hypothetical protein
MAVDVTSGRALSSRLVLPAPTLIAAVKCVLFFCILASVGLRASHGARLGQDATTSQQLIGGTSPDGKYEVRIVEANREPSNYAYVVIDPKTRRKLKELTEGGGIWRYDQMAGRAAVLWHSSASVFALTDPGTQHSQELYLYEVRPTEVVSVAVPHFLDNALGRIGATEVYGTSVVTARRWEGDRLICELDFNAHLPTGPSPTYSVEFALILFHGPLSASRFTLETMGRPRVR